MNRKGTRKMLPLVMAAILAFSAFTFIPGAARADAAPTITGPTSMTLTVGYAATSTAAYAITGDPAPTVSAAGDAAITWNTTTKTLDIAAGLAASTYPVTLTASNSVAPDATLTFTLTVQSVTFTSSPSSINLGNPTNLVFRANAPALLSGFSFEGVAFQNVTAGTGFGMALGPGQGVTYNPATGVLTVPAAAFGQHASIGGGSALTPGNYRAQIQFWDGVSNYYNFYVDFVMTDSGTPQPPSPLPKTGDGFPLAGLLALLGAALVGMGWLGARLRRQKKRA